MRWSLTAQSASQRACTCTCTHPGTQMTMPQSAMTRHPVTNACTLFYVLCAPTARPFVMNLERCADFGGWVEHCIVPLCAAVTMNPGYAGRTELPDNLKVWTARLCGHLTDKSHVAQAAAYHVGQIVARVASTVALSTQLCGMLGCTHNRASTN